MAGWNDALVETWLAGLALGIGSGVAPGPLLALALTTTLRRGLTAGLLVATAPLVSDALIIAAALSLVTNLPTTAATVMSIVGGLVVVAFGVETLRAVPGADPGALRHEADAPAASRWRRASAHPLAQATILNLLNPAPWLFWITAGAALLDDAWTTAPVNAIGFLVAFYVGIVGSKALIVSGIAAGRHRLNARTYRALLTGAAVMLLIVGVILVVRAVATL